MSQRQTVRQMLAGYNTEFDGLYREYKRARSRGVKQARQLYKKQAERLFILIDLLSACAPKENVT